MNEFSLNDRDFVYLIQLASALAARLTAVSADFHAAGLALATGALVAEWSVAPPEDGDGGEFVLAKHG